MRSWTRFPSRRRTHTNRGEAERVMVLRAECVRGVVSMIAFFACLLFRGAICHVLKPCFHAWILLLLIRGGAVRGNVSLREGVFVGRLILENG